MIACPKCTVCMCVRMCLLLMSHEGWPEPYMYTVYDRTYGNFPAENTVYIHDVCMLLANPTHVMYV